MSNVSDYDIRHLAATNSKLAAINVRYRELYREQKLLFRADEYAVPVIAEKAKTLDDLVRVLPDGEKLETVSGGVVGETRAVTVDGTEIVIGSTQGFQFLRSQTSPEFAFLLPTTSPVAETAGPRFQPSLFAAGLMSDDPLGVPDLRTKVSVPLFGFTACGLCGLGIKHSRRCDEDRVRVIEEVAFTHGIHFLVTNGIDQHECVGRGTPWWQRQPEEVVFACIRSMEITSHRFGHDGTRGMHLPNGVRALFRHIRQ